MHCTWFLSFLPLAIQCQPLNIPVNGNFSCIHIHGEFHYQSSCNFKCKEGFLINGAETTMCEASGAWSASEPTCQGLRLSIFPQFQDSGVSDDNWVIISRYSKKTRKLSDWFITSPLLQNLLVVLMSGFKSQDSHVAILLEPGA